MWPNLQFLADLVTFTGEILNGKLHFLCSVQRHSAIFNQVLGCWGTLRHIEAYSDITEAYGSNQIYLEFCIILAYTTVPCSETLAYLEMEVSSKACRTCKMIMHIQSPGIARTVYSSIFKDIYAFSSIFSRSHRRATRREREASPALFENPKKCPDFGKKGLDCKVSIQHVVSRVSRRKNSKLFPCGSSFLCFGQNVYWSTLVTPPPPSPLCPEKFLHLFSGIFLFVKHSTLNVRQFSKYVCLGRCSVNCTVTLCYVLHETHSE